MRIPLPSIPQQPVSNGRYTAPAVVPQESAAGQQIAGLGRAVQGVGYEVSRIADFQQDQLDDAKVTEADNLVADAVRNAKHDPEKGYLTKIGGDAVNGDARKKAEEELDKRIEEIGGTLQNDVQREQWRRRAARRRQGAAEEFADHETRQTKVYRLGTAKAMEDASRIDGRKDLMLIAVDDQSKALGEDETQNKMRRLAATTQFHDERIRILAKSDPAAAAEMLKEAVAAKEIAPAAIDNLQGIVKQSGDDEKAATLFRTIVAEPTRRDMPLSEQNRIALTIADYELDHKNVTAEVWQKTRNLIDHHFAQQHQLQVQRRAEVLQQAETTFTRDKAATPESYLAPLGDQGDQYQGDVAQMWTQVRARQLADDGREFKDFEMMQDVKRVGVLDKLIEDLDAYEPPEDADAETKKKLVEAANKKLTAARQERLIINERRVRKLGIELQDAGIPKADPKKSMADEMREALEAARGILGGK